MATLQDTYADATKLASLAGAEVEGGLLIGTNIDEGVCLDFVPGSSQYVNVGNAGSTVRSITLWINPDDITTTGLLELSGGNRIDIGSSVISTTGLTGPIIYVNGVVTTTIVANVWQHIAVTFTANETASAVTLALSNSAYYDGRIDDVRFFTSELTAAQVRQVYATGDNPETPVNWWKLNDGSGTTATDSGSGADNGTLTNAPTWTTTHQPFYASKSRATSTELLTGLGSTTVNSFLSTIGKHPGGGSGKLQFSSDNATWKNANGDLVSNAGGYSFDGVDDYIIRTLSGTALAQLTVAFWVKLVPFTGTQVGIFQWANTLTSVGPFILLARGASTNTIRLYVDTAYRIDNVPAPADTWLHIAIVLNTSNVWTLYIDGVSAGTYADDATHGLQANAASVYFGNGYNGYCNCLMDDVRVYNVSFTAGEMWNLYSRSIDAHTSSAERLVWWKLDGNANDSSGNGNNGTVSGATSITDWWELPQFGEPIADDFDVLSFDQVNDEITNATADYRSADSLGSVTAWVWVNALGTAQSILSSADTASTTRFWTLEIGTTGKLAIRQNDNGTASSITSTNVLAVGRWYHVAVTSSGTAYVLYINGVAETLIVAAGSNDGDWFADTSARDNVTIGSLKTSSTSQYFGGRIANVSVYSTQLSAATILADFQNGYPSSTNRVTNFPMNEGTGNVTDSDGALTGTVSGATWVKDIARPQPTTPAQQTLSLSLLSFTSAVYCRALYSEIVADRVMALTEVTVDYTGSAGLRSLLLLGVGS